MHSQQQNSRQQKHDPRPRLIGGLVGRQWTGTATGYALGWVIVPNGSTGETYGAVLGRGTSVEVLNAYYNSEGEEDHVGIIGGDVPVNHNGIGTGINGVANATKGNMEKLKKGTGVGQWTFFTTGDTGNK